MDLSKLVDTKSEDMAIAARIGLLDKGDPRQTPKEFTDKYPHWPGYCWNGYPSVSFTRDGHVVFTYMVSDGGLAGLPVGLKLVVRPIDWLYEY